MEGCVRLCQVLWVIACLLLVPTSAILTQPAPGFVLVTGADRDHLLEEVMGGRSWPDRPDLAMDQAWLTVSSRLNISTALLYENGQCFGCPLRKLESVKAGKLITVILSTTFSSDLAIAPAFNTSDVWCRSKIHLQQGADYWLLLDGSDATGVDCKLVLRNDPPNIYLPILYIAMVLLGLAILWAILKTLHRKGVLARTVCWRRSVDLSTQTNNATPTEVVGSVPTSNGSGLGANVSPPKDEKSGTKRLISLDTFRGASLVIMIFVNYGGGGYWFFQHLPWNGLTVADLVFPWFVFIMGSAVVFSSRGMLRRGESRPRMVWHVVRRAALLFLIGVSLNSRWFSNLQQLRIPGVLQRLALTYLLTAAPHMMLTKRQQDPESKGCGGIRDILDLWPEWIIQAGYLVLHLGLTFNLPVPGCPRGYLGPGGMHDGGQYFNCSGGAAGYIDRLLLSNNHIYQYPTFKTTYRGDQAYDPEGILGTFSATFLCFLGLLAGNIVVYHKSHAGRIVRWLVWATVTGAIGAVLCKGSLNEGWIPINKNLWSVSFSLAVSGLAFVFLTLMYILIDVCDVWSGAPFIYPGMNSLVVYVCHEVFATFFPVRWPVEEVHWKLLSMATWSTSCWVILALILYRKRIFIAL